MSGEYKQDADYLALNEGCKWFVDTSIYYAKQRAFEKWEKDRKLKENNVEKLNSTANVSYETLDSGERSEYSSGMVRDTNKSKARYDLIIPKDMGFKDIMTSTAELMDRGAKKYGDRNWEKANTQEELDRFMESAYRHFMQWYRGDTAEDHASAVVFNIQGAEYTKYKMEKK